MPRVKVLSEEEMNALIDEYPELKECGEVYRIVEHDDCYDVYVDQSDTCTQYGDFVASPHNPRNHVFVFDKPLLHTNN